MSNSSSKRPQGCLGQSPTLGLLPASKPSCLCRESHRGDHCSWVLFFFCGAAVGLLCELRFCVSNSKNQHLCGGRPGHNAPCRRRLESALFCRGSEGSRLFTPTISGRYEQQELHGLVWFQRNGFGQGDGSADLINAEGVVLIPKLDGVLDLPIDTHIKIFCFNL